MLVLADWLVTSADEPPRPDAGVRVVGDRITAVGGSAELRAAHPDDVVHHGPGSLLLPGFVNGHVHMYGVLAHGVPIDGAPGDFWEFLADHWWPRVEDALDQSMIAAAAEWACIEMLRSGTTSFYDVLEAPATVPGALAVEREVVDAAGLRGILSFEATERVSEANGCAGLDENVALIEACRDGGGLVSGALCYHTAFTCSEAFIRRAFDLAADHDVFCHAHCNEGVHEPDWCVEHLGRRTLEFYADIGVAGPRLLASQCVQLSDAELDVIAGTGVRCTHMPLSNCEVGGGIAPVPELLDRGVTVGLGSDGYVNDMYEVMRGAFLLHKAARQDPGVMPAATVLAMATDRGAAALGLDRVGRLEPGWAADLQLVDADLPTPLAPHNLVDQLVLWRSQAHVRDVMVAGEWRVRAGEVLGVDVEAVRARVHEQAGRLWAR